MTVLPYSQRLENRHIRICTYEQGNLKRKEPPKVSKKGKKTLLPKFESVNNLNY